MSIRGGSPVNGQDHIETAGTDNDATAPRVVRFSSPDPKPVRTCLVHNPTGANAALLVKVNALAANDFDGDSDDDGVAYWSVAAGATIDVTLEGRLSVNRVSFVTQNAGDDLDAVVVVGWID